MIATRSPHVLAVQELGVRDDVRQIDARQLDRPGNNAGRDDDGVELGEGPRVAHRGLEVHRDFQPLELGLEVGDRPREVLLSRDPARHPELAAEAIRGLEQRDTVSRRGERARCLHAGRPAADNRHRMRTLCTTAELELIAGARVDHARHSLIEDRAIDAGLVAGDADVECPTITRLGDDLGVREKRAGHRHEVRVVRREHLIGERDCVDPVRCDHGDIDGFADRSRPRTPRSVRHQRLDGWHSGLVPAHAHVDRVDRAGERQRSRELDRLD